MKNENKYKIMFCYKSKFDGNITTEIKAKNMIIAIVKLKRIILKKYNSLDELKIISVKLKE